VPEPGRLATPYTPRPQDEAPVAGRPVARGLLVSLIAAVAVAAAVALWLGAGRDSTPDAAAPALSTAQSVTQLWFTDADYDQQATDAARRMLSEGTAPTPASSLPAATPGVAPRTVADSAAGPERATTAGVTAEPAIAPTTASPDPIARARGALARMTGEQQRAVAEGSAGLFRLHVVDSVAEDGDAVSLTLNGIAYGAYWLAHQGFDVTVALTRNSVSQLVVQAVEDGGGGVTLGVQTSTGEQRTRVMQVGETESWIIGYR